MHTDLSSLSGSISDLVAGVADRIVSIRSPQHGSRSGIVWSDGQIVTAEETIEGEGDLTVTFANGRSVKAELVGRDPSTDVALLKVDTGPFAALALAPTPSVGSLAVAIGRGETSAQASFGIVSETGPAWTSLNGGRIDARIHLALRLSDRAEGGAILAPDGRLIGMAVFGPRRKVIAIPGSTIARAINALADKGYVARGFLGLNLQRLNRRGAPGGVIVADTEPGGPAAVAGFVIGDIITTWDGNPINSVGDVARQLGTDTVGNTVTLGLLRAGEPAEKTVVIGERPAA